MPADTTDDYTSFAFDGESSAGVNTIFTADGASVAGGANPGFIQFSALSDAGNALLINEPGQANYEGGDGNDLTLTVVP